MMSDLIKFIKFLFLTATERNITYTSKDAKRYEAKKSDIKKSDIRHINQI